MTSSGRGETFTYDKDGQVTKRKVAGVEYTYAYKNKYARDLDSISVDGISVYPKKDIPGRYTGKQIKRGSATLSEEAISYRKVGNNSTNMPAGETYKSVGAIGSIQDDAVTYSYDSRGNIEEIKNSGGARIAKYTYDALGRLIREDNNAMHKTMVFTYDNNGNIKTKKVGTYTNLSSGAMSGTTTTYTYDSDKKDRMTSFGGESCVYGSMGRPTTYRGKAVTWERGRFISSIGSTTFTTDGEGKRVKKDNITFTYDCDNNLRSQSDGFTFLYDHTGVFGFKYNSSTYYYRKNVLGDIVAILDKDGKVVVKYIYDAWGNHEVENVSGTVIGNLNPFRYRGYYYDTETGLYYLKARYYDPEVGRFISADDLSYINHDHVNGMNLYVYGNNKPVSYIGYNGMSAPNSRRVNMNVRSPFAFTIGQSPTNKRGIPFANAFFRYSHTQSIWGFNNRWWGRVEYSVTMLNEQTDETGFLYAFNAYDYDNDVSNFGVGINVFEWFGVEASYDTQGNIHSYTTITPWFHLSASIGLNGISIGGGVIIDGKSHDFTIGIGIAPILVVAGVVAIVVTCGQAAPGVVELWKRIFAS